MDAITKILYLILTVMVIMFVIPLDVLFALLTASLWQSEYFYRGGPEIELWHKLLMTTVTAILLVGQIYYTGHVVFRFISNRSSQSLKDRM